MSRSGRLRRSRPPLLCAGGVLLLLACAGCSTTLLHVSNLRFDHPSREFRGDGGDYAGRYLGIAERDGIRFHVVSLPDALLPIGQRGLQLWLPCDDPDEVRATISEVPPDSRPSVVDATHAGAPVFVTPGCAGDSALPAPRGAGYPERAVITFGEGPGVRGATLVRYPVREEGGEEPRWRLAWAEVQVERRIRSGLLLQLRRLLYGLTVPLDVAVFPIQIAVHLLRGLVGA